MANCSKIAYLWSITMQARIIILNLLFCISFLNTAPLLAPGLKTAGPRDFESRFQKEKKRTAKLKFENELSEEEKKKVQKKENAEKKEKETGPMHPRRKRALEIRRAFESLSLDELAAKKKEHIANNEKELAIKYVERMMTLTQDQAMLRDLRLELAHLYFDLENYEKAAKGFEEFNQQYPGSPKYEYVAFKAIESLYKQMPDAKRDQTITRDAVTKAKHFLDDVNNQIFRPQVQQMLYQLYERLFEAETIIFEFYISQNKFGCAQKRLDYTKKELAPFISIDEQCKELEEHLAARKKGKRYVPPKKKKQQTSESTKAKPKHKSFCDRF